AFQQGIAAVLLSSSAHSQLPRLFVKTGTTADLLYLLSPRRQALASMPAERPPRPEVVIADDDLTYRNDLFREVSLLFEPLVSVRLFSVARDALAFMAASHSLIGCVTDIVFRHESVTAGVSVAESALKKGVPAVVYTGHSLDNLGIALEELRRI